MRLNPFYEKSSSCIDTMHAQRRAMNHVTAKISTNKGITREHGINLVNFVQSSSCPVAECKATERVQRSGNMICTKNTELSIQQIAP